MYAAVLSRLLLLLFVLPSIFGVTYGELLYTIFVVSILSSPALSYRFSFHYIFAMMRYCCNL
jgi:hypothetical protein